MTKNILHQIDEQTEAQSKYWEDLTPDERRTLAIRRLNAPRSKNAHIGAIILAVIGIPFFAITIYSWLKEYNISLESSLGAIGGVMLAAFGLQYIIKSSRIKCVSKIEANDFSDEDAINYLQELERTEQKVLGQWNRYKYLFFVFGGLFILSLEFPPTKDFSFMVLSSGIGVFLLGIVAFVIVQTIKKR